VSSDGKYYQASFDPKNGGECTKLYEYNLNLTEKDAINSWIRGHMNYKHY